MLYNNFTVAILAQVHLYYTKMKLLISEILKNQKENIKSKHQVLTVIIPYNLIDIIINIIIKPILNDLINIKSFTIDIQLLNKIAKEKICKIWEETSKLLNYTFHNTIYNYVIILEIVSLSINKLNLNNILYISYDAHFAAMKIKKLTNIESVNFIYY
jgi:hypothetical protein